MPVLNRCLRSFSTEFCIIESSGVTVVRPLDVFGYDSAPHGHAEVQFRYA